MKLAAESKDTGRKREKSALRSRGDFLKRKDYSVCGSLEGENTEERGRMPAKICLLDKAGIRGEQSLASLFVILFSLHPLRIRGDGRERRQRGQHRGGEVWSLVVLHVSGKREACRRLGIDALGSRKVHWSDLREVAWEEVG